ncbi:hypothetical protein IEU95_13690 [Hoyosella rhizosphaerae]|uniref:Uncharacterized protein n=1 Tax=Hoyosella rhizosphaerae TaxID=1755582 RepID=A0A916UFS2_9ACTN|nr:hypothetical protein [Hoyosella rhizosphaerae]MBN4927892.1 hypothetical protein [Hoyosella rhizosphaerae]GGC70786.1 hypothetical protein GCM10011410_24580 [Hoyosella rhizosphaerae]
MSSASSALPRPCVNVFWPHESAFVDPVNLTDSLQEELAEIGISHIALPLPLPSGVPEFRNVANRLRSANIGTIVGLHDWTPDDKVLQQLADEDLIDGAVLEESTTHVAAAVRDIVNARRIVVADGFTAPALDGSLGSELARTAHGVLAYTPGSRGNDARPTHYVPRSEFHLVRSVLARNQPHSWAPVDPPETVDDSMRTAWGFLQALGPGIAMTRRAPSDVPQEIKDILRLRAERPGVFVGGEYEPLHISGPAQSHIIGFARAQSHSLPEILCLGVRDQHAASNGWRDTHITLPFGTWHDITTNALFQDSASGTDLFNTQSTCILVRSGHAPAPPHPLPTAESSGTETSAPE